MNLSIDLNELSMNELKSLEFRFRNNPTIIEKIIEAKSNKLYGSSDSNESADLVVVDEKVVSTIVIDDDKAVEKGGCNEFDKLLQASKL